MADTKLIDVLQGLPAATCQLTLDGATVSPTMLAKEFSTGSKGFSWQGKVDGQDGRRYQVNVQAILIGSKAEA